MTRDESDIRDRIAAAEAAINGRDFAALAALYTSDGDTIIATRPRTSGPDAIRRSAEAAWAVAPSARRVHIAVDAIRFLTPDVAIADTIARFTAGEPAEDRGTWVMVRRGGVWKVGAFRVQPAEHT